jgi:D-tyrosyl-tRNA(Tyr) deacylase
MISGEIGVGMLIFAGFSKDDSTIQADYLAAKIPQLRIFADASGKMNLNIREVGGSILAVPNFTLYGDCRKGRRPAFDQAARPELARPLFDHLVEKLRGSGIPVQTGVFGAGMLVELLNDGPVTFVLEAQAAQAARPPRQSMMLDN